jgi:hypothetical protein
LLDWIAEKSVTWIVNQIVTAPIKGLIKLGFLFRKGIEYQKANVPSVRNETLAYLLIPLSFWLLVGALGIGLGGALLGFTIWVTVTIGMVVGIVNTKVDPELKSFQESGGFF